MGSVDISHQTGADQRPACAHAGGRIKPHHAQPPRQKKPLYTSKEIKSRVKSNSRGIVKMGPPRRALHLTRFVCVWHVCKLCCVFSPLATTQWMWLVFSLLQWFNNGLSWGLLKQTRETKRVDFKAKWVLTHTKHCKIEFERLFCPMGSILKVFKL